MPAKKRRLEDVDDELETNPAKKQRLTKEANSNKKEESKSSKCDDCKKNSEKKQCKKCEFEYCSQCGLIIFDRNAVISIDMKCPCSECISRERQGRICCYDADCGAIIKRAKAKGCLHCGGKFCDELFHGESCEGCMEYQCSECSDFKETGGGEWLCTINGCALEYGDAEEYDEDDW